MSFLSKKYFSQCVLLCISLLAISFYSQANYAPKVINPNDGYRIKIIVDSILSETPIYSSDGTAYYQIGNNVDVNSSKTPVSGRATCQGTIWGDNTGLLNNMSAWRKIYVYAPLKNGFINGRRMYKINENTIMVINSDMDSDWIYAPGSNTCSNYNGGSTSVPIQAFEFRLSFSFYVNKGVVDNQIVIPAMNLAGYVRAFMKPNVSPNITSWEFENTTAPIRLEPSILKFPSFCSTSTSTGQADMVNLHHGHLNTLKYDSEVTEKIIYNCNFSELTNVHLQLDYAKDNDPQMRLPLINKMTKEKIYTELTMTDESTGQSGLDMNVNIEKSKVISIKSHLRGTNAPEGDYQGSAWLIATFL